MLSRRFFLLFSSLFLVGLSFAQSTNHFTKREMKNKPVWIEMIKDEQTNYFAAVRAFELYFTKHPFPVMEEEEMGRNEKLKERIEKNEAKFKKKKRKVNEDPNAIQKEKHEEAKMAFEVKRFKHWEMQTRPYVKNDGSIMGTEERMKIWKESNK